MNQEAINLVKEIIKSCEEEQMGTELKIKLLHENIEKQERRLFHVKDMRQSLESALKILEEAKEKKTEAGMPGEYEILKENKEKLEEIEEEELTEKEIEEANKKLIKKADNQITAAKKNQRRDWKKCPVCLVRPIAPWNTKGKCSYCQTYKKKKKDDIE